MAFLSPLGSPIRGSAYRNRTANRARGRATGGQWSPAYLGPRAWYDAHIGGSSTQIIDSSGNGRAAVTNSAGSNAAGWVPYSSALGQFVYLPGVSGNYVSTPDAAALDISGDLEIVARLAADDWTPGTQQGIVTKYGSGSTLAYSFELAATGLSLRLSADGTTQSPVTSTSGVPFSDGSAGWVKVTWRASDGRTQFFTASDQPTEPLSWSQLGSDRTSAVGSIYNSSSALAIGVTNNAFALPLAASVYSVAVRSGIGGTTVAEFSASGASQSTYTDTTAKVWTIARPSAGRKSLARSVSSALRSAYTFGTDDYMTAPSAAIPAMGAADVWSVGIVVRQWDTATNFGRYLSTKLSSGTGKGIAIRSNGTTRQITCHFGDGTNTVDVFGPSAAASGARQVIVVTCSGSSATIWVNGTTGSPTSISAVGDRATSQMQIGRDSGASSNYQDFEFEALVTGDRVWTSGEIAAFSTYYGGGL